jgi:hypothetical protein
LDNGTNAVGSPVEGIKRRQFEPLAHQLLNSHVDQIGRRVFGLCRITEQRQTGECPVDGGRRPAAPYSKASRYAFASPTVRSSTVAVHSWSRNQAAKRLTSWMYSVIVLAESWQGERQKTQRSNLHARPMRPSKGL